MLEPNQPFQKTRQGYARERILKPAGYAIIACYTLFILEYSHYFRRDGVTVAQVSPKYLVGVQIPVPSPNM